MRDSDRAHAVTAVGRRREAPTVLLRCSADNCSIRIASSMRRSSNVVRPRLARPNHD
jgi:hypothetical protein